MDFTESHKNEIGILFEILKVHVKDKFDIDIKSIKEVTVDSRKKHLVYFRKMLMVILGETFIKDSNQDQIAKVVDMDRTSFIYHSKIHLNHYTSYPAYKKEYDEIRNKFLEKIKV
ncbi:MAG: hypothetical protein AABY15_01740 [Nanoarchaeota archaeon]